MPADDRRPLTTRQARWAQALAGALARRRVQPNAISFMSLVAAAGACAALAAMPCVAGPGPRAALLVAAAAGVQLRLLCNMLDGMVAVEGGLRSPTGELWNEVPDRIADALILVGAGYAAAEQPLALTLGWASGLLAAWTAYVRALARGAGCPQFFQGPMGKPHRMAAVTVACIAGALATPWAFETRILWAALVVVCAGAALTLVRRLRLAARDLRVRAGAP